MGLHPEIRKTIDAGGQAIRAAGLTDLSSGGVDRTRSFLASSRTPEDLLAPICSVGNRTIPGPARDISVRIYCPNNDGGLPSLVWFHGGGWVLAPS